MMRTDHNDEFEQLMACLDGELPDADAANVRAHLAQCPSCQELELELRSVSGRVASWTVGEPPASLKSPAVRSRMARLHRWLPVAAMLAVATGAGTIWLVGQRNAPKSAVSITAPGESLERKAVEMSLSYPKALSQAAPADLVSSPPKAGRIVSALPPQMTPLLARSARLTVIASDLNAARGELDRIISDAGGYIGHMRVSDDRGAAKKLSASLHVPERSLDPVLEQLKRLGRTRAEGRDAEDVTQQSSDLDARLNNARTSEKRLVSILANRAGDVADVLNVEREIARVRGEIEQMEAARRNLDRRITFATIQVDMLEETKAELGLGDQSVWSRLRNAAVEGWNTALDGSVEVGVFVAQVAPTMLLWGLALIVPYRLIRRRFT
jgi:hypothetical protein